MLAGIVPLQVCWICYKRAEKNKFLRIEPAEVDSAMPAIVYGLLRSWSTHPVEK
jgi:hypothetical protein